MQRSMPTSSLAWLATRWVAPDSLIAALSVMAAQGLDPEPARRAGRLPADFERTLPRVSFLSAAEVWRHAIEACRDPSLGLRAAQRYLERDPSLIGYLVRTSPTLADGLRDKARFAPVEDELCRCEWVEDASLGIFRFHGSAGFYLPAVAEFVAARLVGAVRCLSTGAVDPVAVRFPHEAPSSLIAHRKHFRASLEFASDAFEVVYRLDALRHPPRTSDPALHALLLDYAEQKLSDALRPRGTAERVRELVTQMWRHGAGELPSRSQVARLLRVTPRTLSRWLEADGKTYSDVLDEFRALAATRGLQRPEGTLGRLAQQLGFKDQSAFTRAFRRWTGMTPGAYRRRYAPRDAARALPAEGMRARPT